MHGLLQSFDPSVALSFYIVINISMTGNLTLTLFFGVSSLFITFFAHLFGKITIINLNRAGNFRCLFTLVAELSEAYILLEPKQKPNSQKSRKQWCLRKRGEN